MSKVSTSFNWFLLWLDSKSRRLWHDSFIYRLNSLLINCRSFRVLKKALFPNGYVVNSLWRPYIYSFLGLPSSTLFSTIPPFGSPKFYMSRFLDSSPVSPCRHILNSFSSVYIVYDETDIASSYLGFSFTFLPRKFTTEFTFSVVETSISIPPNLRHTLNPYLKVQVLGKNSRPRNKAPGLCPAPPEWLMICHWKHTHYAQYL